MTGGPFIRPSSQGGIENLTCQHVRKATYKGSASINLLSTKVTACISCIREENPIQLSRELLPPPKRVLACALGGIGAMIFLSPFWDFLRAIPLKYSFIRTYRFGALTISRKQAPYN